MTGICRYCRGEMLAAEREMEMAQLTKKMRCTCWAGVLIVIVSSGCTTAGNSLMLFPEGHVMIDAAKALKRPRPRGVAARIGKTTNTTLSR